MIKKINNSWPMDGGENKVVGKTVVKLKYLSEIKVSSVDRHYYDDEVNVNICHYPQAYHNEKIDSQTKLDDGSCSSIEFDNFKLKKGQIILTKDSESSEDIGIPTFISGNIANAVCGYHLALVTPNEELVNPEYLFRYLQSRFIRSYFEVNSNGVTRFGLTKHIIENTPIVIPSLKTQLKIVNSLNDSLDLIDELTARKRKIINLLKEKRKSRTLEVITRGFDSVEFTKTDIDWIGSIPKHWKLERVRNIFLIKKNIARELGHEVLSVTQKGIKIKDIKNNKGQQSLDYSKYQRVDIGDFIMNHMDLITGFIDISNYDGVTSPDYRVFSIRNKNYDSRYFLYIFQFCYLNRIFFGLGQGVSQLGRWRMPANQFNNFIIPCPPIDEQKLIADYLERETTLNDKIIDKNLQIIDKLKEYRASIISESVLNMVTIN